MPKYAILFIFAMAVSCTKSIGNIPKEKNPDAVGSCVASQTSSLMDVALSAAGGKQEKVLACETVDEYAIQVCKNRDKKLAGYKIDRFASSNSAGPSNGLTSLVSSSKSVKDFEIWCE